MRRVPSRVNVEAMMREARDLLHAIFLGGRQDVVAIRIELAQQPT